MIFYNLDDNQNRDREYFKVKYKVFNNSGYMDNDSQIIRNTKQRTLISDHRFLQITVFSENRNIKVQFEHMLFERSNKLNLQDNYYEPPQISKRYHNPEYSTTLRNIIIPSEIRYPLRQ